MAEANVTSNNQLPPEVLVKIFDHSRPNLNELVNIVDVCQLWRDVVIHQHMSVNDLVIRHPSDINDLVSLLCKPVSFTKLHIVWDVPSDVDCSSVSLDALANVTSLTHLQSFKFRVEDRPWPWGVLDYSRVLDALLTMLLLQKSTDTLTHFKLINTGSNRIRKVLVELLEACQHLSYLVLNGCWLYDEEGRRYEKIIPTLTHLELLNLRDTQVSFDLSFIAAVKRGCPNISNNIMIGTLRVRPSDDVSLLQFVSHVGRLFIEHFDTAQLRALVSCLNECVSRLSVDWLHVGGCGDITDDILLSLVQPLRGLKLVHAVGCHQLTNEGVVKVITSSPKLERIDIWGIKNITTDIIQLLDRLVTEKDVRIEAHRTKLSDEMSNNPDGKLYTGKNGNICLEY